jgi:DNA-binding transcriptional LysR family regulator
LDIRYEIEDPHTVLSMCAQGLGQGIVPVSVMRSRPSLDVSHYDLSIAGVPMHRSVVALTRKRYAHPLIKLLCDQLAGALAAANG